VPETKNRTDNSVNGQTVEEPTNQIVLQRLLSEIRHLLTELKSETLMSHNQVKD
jgi:hypothetical protein